MNPQITFCVFLPAADHAPLTSSIKKHVDAQSAAISETRSLRGNRERQTNKIASPKCAFSQLLRKPREILSAFDLICMLIKSRFRKRHVLASNAVVIVHAVINCFNQIPADNSIDDDNHWERLS